jgi:hypothetical protein
MKIVKNSWVKISVLCLSLFLLTVTSCKDDFLEVPRTDQLSLNNFPTKPADLDYLLIDLYGRIRNTMYHTNNFPRFGLLMSHEVDQAYIGAEFNFHAKNSLIASNGDVTNLWNGLYENIAKCNAFLAAVDAYKTRNPNLQPSVLKEINIREGQARFIRAFNYFQAEAFFGESFIYSAADASKRGVPLLTKVAASLEETSSQRATVGEVWNFVIQDLLEAEKFLDGITWTGNDRGRVGIWAVKSLLGKTYLFTQRYSEAQAKLKEVIDNSGKKLVNFNTYKNMFNGFDEFEFNEESIFELNHNSSSQGEWNFAQQTSNFSGILMSPAFMNQDRKYDKNGFGNLFIHDKNLARFGYTYPEVIDENKLREGDKWKEDAFLKNELKTYLSNAERIRTDKSVDPRLFVSALQPYYDSIIIGGKARPIVKNQGEGINLTGYYTWSIRKNVAIDRHVWSQGAGMDNNLYILRLADVYLMYAEALIQSGGSSAEALEYINKVKRRAYGLSPDTPSAVDYLSLNDKTMATDEVLANNPLRYERWAELFLEGHWWFDVVRWRLGPKEAAFYQKVGSGNLVWEDRAYAMPIPESEINSNPGLKGQQNPGY